MSDSHATDKHAQTRSQAGSASTAAVEEQPSPTEASETTAPSWFRRKRAQRRQKNGSRSARRRKPAPIIRPVAEEEPELTRGERLIRWVRSSLFAGYLASFLLHATLMILLSIVLSEGMTGQDDFSTLWTQADSGPEKLELLNTELEMQAKSEPAEMDELPQFQTVETSLREAPPPDMAEKLQSSLDEQLGGEGGGEEGGEGLSVPQSGNAVTKGSFTAWTVPEDPGEDEDYLIVIQIAVPERVRRYPVRDLSGLVTGTDGYRQKIPGSRRGFLPKKDDRAQLVIPVPGARKLPNGERVRDTIRIRSRILEEQQTLEIEF